MTFRFLIVISSLTLFFSSGCDSSEVLDTPDLSGSRGLGVNLSGAWLSEVESISGTFTQRFDVSYSPTYSEPEVQYSVWEVDLWTEAEFSVTSDSVFLHLEMPYEVRGFDWYLLGVISLGSEEPTEASGLHRNINSGWFEWEGPRSEEGSPLVLTGKNFGAQLTVESTGEGLAITIPEEVPFTLERMSNRRLKDGESELLRHSPFSEPFKAEYSVVLTKVD